MADDWTGWPEAQVTAQLEGEQGVATLSREENVERLLSFFDALPMLVVDLAVEFPPLARVRAREGESFLAPAPGCHGSRLLVL